MKEKIKKKLSIKTIFIIAVIIYIINLVIMFPVRQKNCRNAQISFLDNPTIENIGIQNKLCSPFKFLGF